MRAEKALGMDRGKGALPVQPRAVARMRDRRTLEQNKRFHAMVRDIAQQVEWAGEKMDEEDWKRLLLASAYGQKVVPNPFGGNFVVVNIKRSSELP